MGEGRTMTAAEPVGPLLHSYFAGHLIAVKGLRPASVRSYRDTIRLLLVFTAADKGCKITRLRLEDLTFDRVTGFLRHLEQDRGNHVRTRNQRLAAVHSLFEYLASRDRALVLFLYNTGARVQEAADLRAGHLDLGEHPLARLHGKGDKWRTCPLWHQTAELLNALLRSTDSGSEPEAAVFSAKGQPLTRYGIYKIVRRHAAGLDDPRTGRRISPHIFRHYVDGRVMWPEAASPLVAEPRLLVPAT